MNLVGDNLIHIMYLDGDTSRPAGRLEPDQYDSDQYDSESSVLGPSRIAPSVPYRATLGHAICVASQSEQFAYEEAVSGYAVVPMEESREFHIARCSERHDACKMCGKYPEKVPEEERQALEVNLSVLGVCRQLYEEANHLLWATNTFSFDESVAFEKFLGCLNPAQKHNLSSIHISAPIGGYNNWPYYGFTGYQWGKALKATTMNVLRGIRSIHLCLNQRFNDVWADNDAEAADISTSAFHRDVEPFLRLRALPAIKVTVVVSDPGADAPGPAGYPGWRWTMAKKNEYAEEIRAQIADPHGAEDLKMKEAARKLADKIRTKEKAARKALGAKDRATRAQAEADQFAKEAQDATVKAGKAGKEAERASAKNGAKAEQLHVFHDELEKEASFARDVATRAAKIAVSCHADAVEKAARAKKAKARAEGRKIKAATGMDDEDEMEEEEGEEAVVSDEEAVMKTEISSEED